MSSRWLDDELTYLSHPPIISTHQSRIDLPHTPADILQLHPPTVEAMDDTLLPSTLLPTLYFLAHCADHFQATYEGKQNGGKVQSTSTTILSMPAQMVQKLSGCPPYPILIPNPKKPSTTKFPSSLTSQPFCASQSTDLICNIHIFMTSFLIFIFHPYLTVYH